MRKPNYRVRVLDGSVIAEHRVSLGSVTVSLILVGYLCYCFLPGVRQCLWGFYTSPDSLAGVFALFLLLIPGLSIVCWFRLATGEVLYCDRNELQFARRRTWGRWRRFRFSAGEVKNLRRAVRSAGKSNYTVLTFNVQGRTYDLLENMKYTDCNQVLRACRSMGVDVVIDETADAMLKDIDKRGWWVNPLRRDDAGQ